MRRALVLSLLLAAGNAAAEVTFVSPLAGSQAFGPAAIEVMTDAAGVDRVDFFVDGVLAGAARRPPYRIAFDFGDSLAARTITAKVWKNGYQTTETAAVTTAAITVNDSIHIDLVEVPLRVRAGRKVSTGDLRVVENGREQVLGDLRADRPPAHFAFVVDRSLSMGNGRLHAALRAVEAGLTRLRPGDSASLVLFNHHVAKPRALTRRAKVAADVLPSGGTSLRDAVASIASKERTYAIVITDGGDRSSELTDEAALRRVSGTKTIAHAIVLGRTHAKFLDDAARNTGGSVVRATPDTLGRTLAAILEDINSRYTAVYQSNATKRGWRTIEVTARKKDVTIGNARKGYFAE